MRDLAISIYLCGYKVLFTFFKLFPLRDKVVFLVSFPDNPLSVYEELRRQKIPVDVVFLSNNRSLKTDAPIHNFNSLQGIFHLATAKQIIADNYYGILSVTNFKPDVKVTQIWHAAGAIKRFGAADPANKTRTQRALNRFKRVYHRFDFFTVGSDFMGEIFKQAYLATDEKLLKTGVPRTDFFFGYENQPLLTGKKIILYAPTFRRCKNQNDDFRLDVEKMKKVLAKDYVLVVKSHPAVKMSFTTDDFVLDYSDRDINELMIAADVLITDYSSLPMEFAMLGRPMIFYAYDLENYEQEHGFWEPYMASVPGPTVTNTVEIISALQNIEPLPLNDYLAKWATYNDGHASEKLINALFKN